MDGQVKSETQNRHYVLRELIREGTASTQEELCEALRRKKFDVTQSTVSRDLRRIGAVKATNVEGEIIYRLPEDALVIPQIVNQDLSGLVTDIQANESMIVMHTTPGSASLVATYLDSIRKTIDVLGTIAGDDAIFIVPSSIKKIPSVINKIKEGVLY